MFFLADPYYAAKILRGPREGKSKVKGRSSLSISKIYNLPFVQQLFSSIHFFSFSPVSSSAPTNFDTISIITPFQIIVN